MDNTNLTESKEFQKAVELVKIDRIEQIESLLKDIYLSTKEVLTVDEACKITGFKKSYMYKLTHLKKIPHYRPTNGAVFFDKVELIEWLKQNKQEVKK